MSAPAAIDPAALGRVVVVSPHDDDGNVGCGGLIQALPAPPLVVVVTDGRLGYQDAAEKDTIVAVVAVRLHPRLRTTRSTHHERDRDFPHRLDDGHDPSRTSNDNSCTAIVHERARFAHIRFAG